MTAKTFNRRHTIIPEEDTIWALGQKLCVLKFWNQCWLADPYGSRWMKLKTSLSDSAFRFARRILEAARLFLFRRISIGSDGRTSIWEVRNLHGARVKDFWQGVKNEADTASNKADTAPQKTITASNKAPILAETQSEQVFQEPSGTPQEHITNSSKEFVMCVSSTQNEIPQGEETAHAPLGGASPQIVESVEEKEEDLPMAIDCTTLTLVDDASSQPALLSTESQNSGEEVKNSHEGTCSATQVSQNEKLPIEVEASSSALLMAENPVTSVEVRDSHEDTCSAAPVASFDKWSSDAIAARSKARPERMEKIKMAGIVGENPGFEYLQECWNDDPALQIVIKKLLGKFPQWGIVCVDGVLVDWDNET
jgi:hypothetical protein